MIKCSKYTGHAKAGKCALLRNLLCGESLGKLQKRLGVQFADPYWPSNFDPGVVQDCPYSDTEEKRCFYKENKQ